MNHRSVFSTVVFVAVRSVTSDRKSSAYAFVAASHSSRISRHGNCSFRSLQRAYAPWVRLRAVHAVVGPIRPVIASCPGNFSEHSGHAVKITEPHFSQAGVTITLGGIPREDVASRAHRRECGTFGVVIVEEKHVRRSLGGSTGSNLTPDPSVIAQEDLGGFISDIYAWVMRCEKPALASPLQPRLL